MPLIGTCRQRGEDVLGSPATLFLTLAAVLKGAHENTALALTRLRRLTQRHRLRIRQPHSGKESPRRHGRQVPLRAVQIAIAVVTQARAGAAIKLARTVCRILIASTLVVIVWGCDDLFEEDEEEWQRELEISTTRANPTVTVGPWVTCVAPPLCNEYLTYDLQAWDEIFYSCSNSSDGRECPSDYNLRCAVEYDDRDDIERRVLYGDANQISSIRFTSFAMNSAGSDACQNARSPLSTSS